MSYQPTAPAAAPAKPPAFDLRLNGALFWQMCALAFTLMASYAIAGAATQSLFVQAYGSNWLPYAWLGVAGATFGTTWLIGQLNQRKQVLEAYVLVAFASTVLLVALLGLEYVAVPFATFFLYIWKDIYIVLLVELFWTFANIVFATAAAKDNYGLFCAAGSIGTIAANFLVPQFVMQLGTRYTMWLTVPLLLLSTLGCLHLHRMWTPTLAAIPRNVMHHKLNLSHGLRVLRSSPYLSYLLAIVASMQIAVTIIDFQASYLVESAYQNPDERTAIYSYVLGAMGLGGLLLQLFNGPIMHRIGLAKAFIATPAVLLAGIVVFLITPSFWPMMLMRIAGKSMDYSLFRASKEMLYIPLTYAEKTQGKSLIDMLTYRVAKGVASLLVLSLAGFQSMRLLSCITGLLIGIWLWCAYKTNQGYARLVHTTNPQPATAGANSKLGE